MRIPARTNLRFTEQDAELARDEWGMNCGPGSLAAIMGMTLDEVRPHMGDFEKKRYTNPTLMLSALKSVGAKWRSSSAPLSWPAHGLARIQWEGPWTKPGVPIAARYRHTHWVAAQRGSDPSNVGIFDINCMNSGGWINVRDWSDVIVPWLLGHVEPKADGRWHLTHVIEIEP